MEDKIFPVLWHIAIVYAGVFALSGLLGMITSAFGITGLNTIADGLIKLMLLLGLLLVIAIALLLLIMAFTVL